MEFDMSLQLKVPPVALVLLLCIVILGTAPYLPVVATTPILTAGLSALLCAGAVSFSLFGVIEFRRHKTTVDPRFPAKSSALVTRGVYALSRNPMYVGFALFLCALVVYLRSPYLLTVVVVFVLYMNRFQIAPEERALQQQFADDYAVYKQKVRRWL
jgi:protein-S-isoprenylcysteine O-methyltransferase Ste14